MIQLDTIFFHRASISELSVTEHDFSEIFRYAGIQKKSLLNQDELFKFTELAKNSITEISAILNARCVYIKTNFKIENSTQILFLDKKIQSNDLSKNLQKCSQVYLFAATLGSEVDKLIFKYSKLNPTLSVFLQATGAMFIEKYCDFLQQFFSDQEKTNCNNLVSCFSPGYGDLKLETQNIFFDLLQCQKNLALTLNNSLIMSPEKSVTAFIGVKNNE